MSSGIPDIIDRLSGMVTFDVTGAMGDADFIANIDALNLLCNLHDDLGLDRTAIRRRMDGLYPELIRRIRAKEDIQLAMPLIKALYRFIYDRDIDSEDRGPVSRQVTFQEMCASVVDSYRRNPVIHSSDYLFALSKLILARQTATLRARLETAGTATDNGARLETAGTATDNSASCETAGSATDNSASRTTATVREGLREYRDILDNYLTDIDEASLSEKILRLKAHDDSTSLAGNTNAMRWEQVRDTLLDIAPHQLTELSDDTLLLWSEATDLTPSEEPFLTPYGEPGHALHEELRRRALSSPRIRVEQLRAAAQSDFDQPRRAPRPA